MVDRRRRPVEFGFEHRQGTDVGSTANRAADDLVVLAGPNAELVACEYETGDEAWTCPLEGAFASTPAVADDALFVGTDAGTVYALE